MAAYALPVQHQLGEKTADGGFQVDQHCTTSLELNRHLIHFLKEISQVEDIKAAGPHNFSESWVGNN